MLDTVVYTEDTAKSKVERVPTWGGLTKGRGRGRHEENKNKEPRVFYFGLGALALGRK